MKCTQKKNDSTVQQENSKGDFFESSWLINENICCVQVSPIYEKLLQNFDLWIKNPNVYEYLSNIIDSSNQQQKRKMCLHFLLSRQQKGIQHFLINQHLKKSISSWLSQNFKSTSLAIQYNEKANLSLIKKLCFDIAGSGISEFLNGKTLSMTKNIEESGQNIKREDFVLIIGNGEFQAHLASELAKKGNNVVFLLEKNQPSIKQLCENLSNQYKVIMDFMILCKWQPSDQFEQKIIEGQYRVSSIVLSLQDRLQLCPQSNVKLIKKLQELNLLSKQTNLILHRQQKNNDSLNQNASELFLNQYLIDNFNVTEIVCDTLKQAQLTKLILLISIILKKQYSQLLGRNRITGLNDDLFKNKPLLTNPNRSTQQQKKLTIPEAYFTGIKDPYNAKSNPMGYIIYGVSINRRVMPKALEYLPKFLTANDLHYGNFGGNSSFNELVATLTGVYSKNQTMSVHNLSCVIDLFAKKHKKVSSQGSNSFISLDPIFEYAGAELLSEQDSVCHIIFSSQSTIQQDLKKVQKSHKTTLMVLQDIKLNSRVENENVFVCYQCSINQSIEFASVHSCNPKKLQELIYYFNLHSISTLTQAAALSKIQPIQASNLQQGQQKMKTEIKAMIKDLDKTDIQNHNLHFFIGATSILAFIAKTFFKPGDTVSVDTPLYAEIQGDFESRVTLKYVHENLFKGTLLKRVIRAKEDGSNGYVIVNANNPTGYVYPQSEIREVGEWAAKNTEFTIVFDEMYINLVYGKAKTCSSVIYAVQSPNVQTIRGFAKQFGLCGFKVAYLITSSQKAISSYDRWKSLLVPHPYSLWTIGSMLQSSNHGKQILSTGCEMARQAIETTCLQLDRWNLKYMKPEAGVFVFVDLRDYLKQNIQLNEYLIFKKMFYEYKVNASCGLDYKSPEPGFFRICTVIDEESIKEGIRRLGLMIKGESFI